MFDSAATELIKKPFFFSSQMLCVEGFGLYFWMFNEVSCPARRQSSHCLAAKALPCCCVIRPVPAGSAVVSATPCGGVSCCSVLPQQWQAASAVGVYLSWGGLPWQRLAASVVGVYLSWGRLPR